MSNPMFEINYNLIAIERTLDPMVTTLFTSDLRARIDPWLIMLRKCLANQMA